MHYDGSGTTRCFGNICKDQLVHKAGKPLLERNKTHFNGLGKESNKQRSITSSEWCLALIGVVGLPDFRNIHKFSQLHARISSHFCLVGNSEKTQLKDI
jgi:hypothetical protein